MKTLVVGTGVIGTTYGWALAEAGVDVTHYVRPGSPDAEAVREASLDVLDDRRGHPGAHIATYPMRCVARVDATDGYELVLVAVNAHQLAEVLTTLGPVVGPDAVFLLMTSNWEGPAAVDALLPRERYLLGYPDCGGTARAEVYWVELGDRVHLGALEGQSAERLAEVAALFASADMRPDVRSDILHWLWVHNASATGFAAGYAKYGGVEELDRRPAPAAHLRPGHRRGAAAVPEPRGGPRALPRGRVRRLADLGRSWRSCDGCGSRTRACGATRLTRQAPAVSPRPR